MPPRPDPRLPSDPPALAPDRTLWWGLAGGIALIALLALAVHRFVPQAPQGGGSGKAELNRNAPLMTRPQLLENQQAMPELLDFDAQNPPPNPATGGGTLGTPGSPSSLGPGALGQ